MNTKKSMIMILSDQESHLDPPSVVAEWLPLARKDGIGIMAQRPGGQVTESVIPHSGEVPSLT